MTDWPLALDAVQMIARLNELADESARKDALIEQLQAEVEALRAQLLKPVTGGSRPGRR